MAIEDVMAQVLNEYDGPNLTDLRPRTVKNVSP
jgi:hypothetical protein